MAIRGAIARRVLCELRGHNWGSPAGQHSRGGVALRQKVKAKQFRTGPFCRTLGDSLKQREETMRSILLYLLGIPIPIIILIGLFSHF